MWLAFGLNLLMLPSDVMNGGQMTIGGISVAGVRLAHIYDDQ